MRAERWEYRLAVSDVDRGLTFERTVVLGRQPVETTVHLALRVLAFGLLYREDMQFGPGAAAGGPEAPDLFANDLTGKLCFWVGCGPVDPEVLRKLVQHNRGMQAHVLFAGEAQRAAFMERVTAWSRAPRGWNEVQLWTLPEELVDGLAAQRELRQRWAVTIVGEHIYVDADGLTLDGPVVRTPATHRAAFAG